MTLVIYIVYAVLVFVVLNTVQLWYKLSYTTRAETTLISGLCLLLALAWPILVISLIIFTTLYLFGIVVDKIIDKIKPR